MSSRSITLLLPLAVAALAAPVVLRVVDRNRADAPDRTTVTSVATAPAGAPTTRPLPTTAAVAVTASVLPVPSSPTTAAVAAVPAPAVTTRFRVGADPAGSPGQADAWRLEPLADGTTRLAHVLTTLVPGSRFDAGLVAVGLPVGTTFTATASAVTWRYAAAALGAPVPDRCVGMDLSDPRAFPRCEEAKAEAEKVWRGGTGAAARAAQLWATLGYAPAALAPASGPDGRGYVTSRLLLGGAPGPFVLRVRFQGDAVEVAEGVLATPVAVADQRVGAGAPLGELLASGPAEVRSAAGVTLEAADAPADATIVAAEPALVAVSGPASDPARYAVPGYAFVASDGTRYLRPAGLVAPWSAA